MELKDFQIYQIQTAVQKLQDQILELEMDYLMEAEIDQSIRISSEISKAKFRKQVLEKHLSEVLK